MNTLPANPFYAARFTRTQPKNYALLPTAPVNTSPVPRLTSLYHHAERGNYGDRRYPGNCSGELIKDLLLYFQPEKVLDPMTGSGTCRDVCQELEIPCHSNDLRYGCDAASAASYPIKTEYPFIWLHPPYGRMKLYTTDPRDLSRAVSLEDFLERYAQVIRNCASTLTRGGILGILMGDYSDRDWGFTPLVYYTKKLAFEAGLQQHCTDIIRFSHGATSSRKVYRSSFIPGLHDVCMLFTRP